MKRTQKLEKPSHDLKFENPSPTTEFGILIDPPPAMKFVSPGITVLCRHLFGGRVGNCFCASDFVVS